MKNVVSIHCVDRIYHLECFGDLNVFIWDQVKRIVKKEAYCSIAKKMIGTVNVELAKWRQVYFLYQVAEGEEGMDSKAKQAANEIIKYFREQNIPENEWLAIINQMDEQIQQLAKKVPINQLSKIVKEKKKEI